MESDIGNIIQSGSIGVAAGFMGGIGVFGFLIAPLIDETRIFQREEGKPAAMRFYKSGRDGIAMQEGEKYIPFDMYLEKIPNRADRKIEEAEIRKAVGWYD